ncbi:MAG: DUF3025 domain-containing protein [Sideroxydans sp.]|nr:DUF3025 domain-containing protein [Sideroxydans sp.]
MNNSIAWDKPGLLGSPMFAPLHPILSVLEDDQFPSLQICNDLLAEYQPNITVQQGWQLSFVPQVLGKQGFESQYEPRCYLKGEVQMRENNWHDLLNALVWLTFPKTKAAINARHYHALTNATKQATSSQRGAVRDTNTLLDESGVIVVCADAELATLLQNFQWQELFWQRREQVKSSMGFYIFGHGLYEKALQPYIGMTGQGVVLSVEQAFFNWPLAQQLAHLDTLLADRLALPEYGSTTRELSPVPLLGVPGWAADNECEAYYENTHYFRPGRR